MGRPVAPVAHERLPDTDRALGGATLTRRIDGSGRVSLQRVRDML